MPYEDFLYFVSYARDDLYVRSSSGLVEDPYLAKFLADLRNAARSKAGRQQDDRIDFRDTERTGLGQQWRSVVIDGLQRCRTVVALYTPTFFGRVECARELAFMQERRVRQFAGGPRPHDFIIPIVWEKAASIPPALVGINYFDAKLPPAYQQYGLKVLARQSNRFATEYEQCVEALAQEIENVRQLAHLPRLPEPIDPDELPNLFAATNPALAGTLQAAPIKGPNGVRFAYVAASRDELANKQHVAPYGARGEEWQPSPQDDRAVGMVAPMVAAASRFIPYQLPLDSGFSQQISVAEQENALVVVLVDVWSACLVEKYRHLMQQYDARGSVHSAALVVWNEQDIDISARRAQLEYTLQHAVFPVNHSRAQPYYHRAIESVGDLESSLRNTLERLRNEVIARAEAFRALDSQDFSARPTISNVVPVAGEPRP